MNRRLRTFAANLLLFLLFVSAPIAAIAFACCRGPAAPVAAAAR
jgi:hypothetical protein